MAKEAKNPKTQPGKTEAKKTKVAAEVVQPLKVEINFPFITDLKQALAMDADGNLVIALQFKAKADQFEIFRLINLLKQPHGPLYAVIGSPQSAMDFKFDAKQIRFEIFKADQKFQASKKEPKQLEPPEPENQIPAGFVKLHSVSFNHFPEDPRPYGVFIEYLTDSTGEIKSAAGRGNNPTEAVIAGVKACGAVNAELSEPFEIRAALEDVNHGDPNPECFKLIRVLDVGEFEIEGDTTEDKGD